MRLHARSGLGVAIHNQKRLLASPTTPELLKRVVYVHFKYLCRCALRAWAPLLCGCRKEFWHHGLPLSEALSALYAAMECSHWSHVGDVQMRLCFHARPSRPATTRTRRGPARQMATAERTQQPMAIQNALT